MKKIISVLLLALTLTLFSSCIIVTSSKHTLTFTNALADNPYNIIYDWYVCDSNDNIYVANEDANTLYPGERGYIDLEPGTYNIVFSHEDTSLQGKHAFYRTETINIYSDKEFKLTQSVKDDCVLFQANTRN